MFDILGFWFMNGIHQVCENRYNMPVVVETPNGFNLDCGVDLTDWFKQHTTIYEVGLAFRQVDTPIEVNVLSVDFLIPENEGKVYKDSMGYCNIISRNANGELEYRSLYLD